MHEVYLGLGSNLGDRRENIERAVSLIAERVGTVLRRSSLMETEPWGFDSQNKFLNAVILCETALTPRQLLKVTQQIERDLGRTHKRSMDNYPFLRPYGSKRPEVERSIVNYPLPTYADRCIDIDILLYDDLKVDEPDLKIPHPLMEQRDFVMIPLNEIQQQLITKTNEENYPDNDADRIGP
jgi:2-amino-4-hydroxy-6-hydroxymethyldihydropteridine diphosphokinase